MKYFAFIPLLLLAIARGTNGIAMYTVSCTAIANIGCLNDSYVVQRASGFEYERAKALLESMKLTSGDPILTDTKRMSTEQSTMLGELSQRLGQAFLPSRSNVSLFSVYLEDTLQETGWDYMVYNASSSPESFKLITDRDIFYGMGVAEAHISFDRLKDTYTNVGQILFQNKEPGAYEKMTSLLKSQHLRSRTMIKNNPTNRVYQALDALLAQIDGLDEHYTKLHFEKYGAMPLHAPRVLAHRSDFGDLFRYIYREENLPANCWDISLREAEFQSRIDERCSAYASLVTEIDPLTKELVPREFSVAHSTWTDYRDRIRVVRTLMLSLNMAPQGRKELSIVSYSGYYGMFSSYDDMYALRAINQQLVVMETTNSLCDMSLIFQMKPLEMLTHQRAMIANFLASTGQEWAEIFSTENSGTYNNQWMIFDRKQIDHVKSKAVGLFVVLEQSPGLIVTRDMSAKFIEQGFWVSYNKPYFPEVFQQMGFARAEEVHGDYYSYTKNARAQIFKREIDQAIVEKKNSSSEWIKKLMRMNNWQTDPLSLKTASFALAGRYDLNLGFSEEQEAMLDEIDPSFLAITPKWGIHGATDAKLVTSTQLKIVAVAGITAENQVPFSWDDERVAPKGYSHVSVPDDIFGWQSFLF